MSEIRVSSIKNLAGDPLITKESLGLEQVDNTSDAQKPVSIATQSALDNIEQIPPGGTVLQSLKKTTVNDFDVNWFDSSENIRQSGVTLSDTPLILSTGGGSSPPTQASEALNLTTTNSFLLYTKVVARATNGLTKTWILKTTASNFSVLNSTQSEVFGEVGSESWNLQVSWDAGINSYILTATGYAAQAVSWNTITEVLRV